MALNRDQITLPALPEEIVPVPSLGGDVRVRAMLLNERLVHDNLVVMARKPLEGETDDDARARAGSMVVAQLLHVCVVDDGGNRLLTPAEWNAVGASARDDVYKLFNVARRLCGKDQADVEKN